MVIIFSVDSIYVYIKFKTPRVTENVNWLELDRSPRAIRFYCGDDFVLDPLSRFVSTALEVRDTCVVIATEAHLNALAEHLAPGRIGQSKGDATP
jgi:hypothetical protein